MYSPPYFVEDRLEVLHALIRSHPFATLLTLASDPAEIPSDTSPILATHLPLVLDSSTDAGPFGTLRGHISIANHQWKDPSPSLPALVLFQGPDAYISPNWYATKHETGQVVPTWNYAVVHAHCTLRLFRGPEQLLPHLHALTNQQEATLTSDNHQNWTVADAPADYIAGQMKGIVGVELRITRLEGKWKASQNHPERNRAGVVSGLRSLASDSAHAMADLVAAKPAKDPNN